MWASLWSLLKNRPSSWTDRREKVSEEFQSCVLESDVTQALVIAIERRQGSLGTGSCCPALSWGAGPPAGLTAEPLARAFRWACLLEGKARGTAALLWGQRPNFCTPVPRQLGSQTWAP